jgi:succinyl-CoA synthetase alpha subunit
MMSKSGTLSYEIGYRLVQAGLGQSLWVGVGGDAVKGVRFADLLPVFAADPATRAITVIGEIGGTEEEELAGAMAASPPGKPVYVLIAGSAAPEGVTMGHAGALIHGTQGSVASKTAALEAAGAAVFRTMHAMVAAISRDAAAWRNPASTMEFTA